ncbi:uncharacterized [Tachysurus ichikawai]
MRVLRIQPIHINHLNFPFLSVRGFLYFRLCRTCRAPWAASKSAVSLREDESESEATKMRLLLAVSVLELGKVYSFCWCVAPASAQERDRGAG